MKWAVILAGGNGSRLQPLTQALTGDNRPKQFCPLFSGQTLLALTRARLALNVIPSRTLCVVTREHEAYYRQELSDLRPSQLIEQPSNRGTAAAIAYGIARVRAEDRKGVVGLFPADHHYEDVETFCRTVDATYRAALRHPSVLFLLGTEPDGPEVEYGWIEPGTPIRTAEGQAYSVQQFWEKPSTVAASELLARGCLWNTFVMIGSVGAFRTLLYSALPDVARSFQLLEEHRTDEAAIAERVYADLPAADFSRDVLSLYAQRAAVVRLPKVGWTDLGHPTRVRTFLALHGSLAPVLGVAS